MSHVVLLILDQQSTYEVKALVGNGKPDGLEIIKGTTPLSPKIHANESFYVNINRRGKYAATVVSVERG